MIKEFKNGKWFNEVNVRDFIQKNYTPYDGDESFLEVPTENTNQLWNELSELMIEEGEKGGVLDIDANTISTIVSHKAGYINKDLETIVGVQTDAPLKRAIMPFGGIRMVESALKSYGYDMNNDIKNVFKYRKTHNDGVFTIGDGAVFARFLFSIC